MKKRLLSLLLVLVMVLTLLPTVAFAADSTENGEQTLLQADLASLSLADQLERRQLSESSYASGVSLRSQSEAEAPFYISTAKQLLEMATNVNEGNANYTSAHYELIADIDLSGVCGENVGGGTSWTPIGSTDTKPFSGTFDGKNYSVSGLYINSVDGGTFHGLFGFVTNGTIKNVHVADVSIRAAGARNIVGGVVANAADSTIQNCHISGSISAYGTSVLTYIGGVVGTLLTRTGESTIDACTGSATVSASGTGLCDIGGVVGLVAVYRAISQTDGCTVKNCTGSGMVRVSLDASVGAVAGRLVGFSEETETGVCTVENCIGAGTMIADAGGATSVYGSVAGQIVNYASVKNCTGSSTIFSSYTAGGVVGVADKKSSVEGCLGNALLRMTPSAAYGSEYFFGGVVGKVDNGSSVKKCYNTSALRVAGSSSNLGGVVGRADGVSSIENCYNSGAVSVTLGSTASAGGVVGYAKNKTTVQNCYSSGAVSAIWDADCIGGVVGRADGGSDVTSCVALSPSVNSARTYDGAHIGAVLGCKDSPPAIKSYYWSGMSVSGRNDGSTKLSYDSENKTLSTQFSDIFSSDNTAWIYTENGLPTLSGVDGAQSSKLPGHITENATFLMISTAGELLDFAAQVNGTDGNTASDFAGKTVLLTVDIDLSGVCGADVGGNSINWTPIGTSDNSFSGSFDGQGHAVSKLYINNNGETVNGQGLFGCIKDGTVKNVNVEKAHIAGGRKVGGVVGIAAGRSVIQSCYSSGTISGGDEAKVGGVVGSAESEIEMKSCCCTGAVSGGANANVGGVAGYTGAAVKNCYSTGAVSGGDEAKVGGVAGYTGAAVKNCYSTGAVSGGANANVGGVAGIAAGQSVIQSCYSTGAVSGGVYSSVGGVVGGGSGGACSNNVALNSGVSGGVYSSVGAVAGGGVETGNNCYWGGMSVRRNGDELICKDSCNSAVLTLRDSSLYNGENELDWAGQGFDGANGWLPPYKLRLPLIITCADHPVLPSDYTQKIVLTLHAATADSVTLFYRHPQSTSSTVYYAAYTAAGRMVDISRAEFNGNSTATLQLPEQADSYKLFLLNVETLVPMLPVFTYDNDPQGTGS